MAVEESNDFRPSEVTAVIRISSLWEAKLSSYPPQVDIANCVLVCISGTFDPHEFGEVVDAN